MSYGYKKVHIFYLSGTKSKIYALLLPEIKAIQDTYDLKSVRSRLIIAIYGYVKMSTKPTKSTSKGEAFERILNSIAAGAPFPPTRDELLKSHYLRHFHSNHKVGGDFDKADNVEDLSDTEKRNAAKALGRMVASQAVREVLILNGHHDRVNLPESGLISVAVSLPVLQSKKQSQEHIAQTIRRDTTAWTINNRTVSGIPILLNDIWIVHGSDSMDMLVQVSYQSSKVFMNYVREVLQQIEGILSTHTMQISSDLATTMLKK